MFIPWLKGSIVKKSFICYEGVDKKQTNKMIYKSIMKDKSIQKMIDNGILFIDCHPCGQESTLTDICSVSIANIIGNVYEITPKGIVFERADNDISRRVFRNINANKLRVSSYCIGDEKTGEVRLLKLILGYLNKDKKFVLI